MPPGCGAGKIADKGEALACAAYRRLFLRDLSVMKRAVFSQQRVVGLLANRQRELRYLHLVIDPVANLELLVRQPPARIEISIVASAVGVVPHRGDKALLPSR